jgi:hypothetical protein
MAKKSIEKDTEQKKSAGRMFLNFLMYGGWFLILVVGLVGYVLVTSN